MRFALVGVVGIWGSLAAQAPPKVVSMDPPHLAEVDAKEVTKLEVVFDQPMDQKGDRNYKLRFQLA